VPPAGSPFALSKLSLSGIKVFSSDHQLANQFYRHLPTLNPSMNLLTKPLSYWMPIMLGLQNIQTDNLEFSDHTHCKLLLSKECEGVLTSMDRTTE
jgi:hypothetical protein